MFIRLTMRKARGYILMEVLVMVAIIGIIAAIAVPNVMSANIRAKVRGIKADMASIAIALENYKADYGAYPIQPESEGDYGPDEIGESNEIFGSHDESRYFEVVGIGKLIFPFEGSDPIYLNRISGDIFHNDGIEEWTVKRGDTEPGKGKHDCHYCYFTGKSISGGRANTESGDTKTDYWALVSWGPDKKQDVENYLEAWKAVDPNAPGYDPSKAYNSENGITSDGDIIMIGL